MRFGVSRIVAHPSCPVGCSPAADVTSGVERANTRTSRTEYPRVSDTWTRSSIAVPRERTGFGVNRMPSTTSRAGSATLVAGIEYFPFARRSAPGGSAGPVPCTAAVGLDAAVDDPWLFRPVT